MQRHQANQRGRRFAILLSCAAALVGCAGGEGSSTGFGPGAYPGVDEDDSTTAADDPDPSPFASSSGADPTLTTALPPDATGSDDSSSTGDEDPSIGDEESSTGEAGCTAGCAEDCFDGEDNDGDGDLDCDDTECESVTICSCTVVTGGAFGTHVFCPMLSTWDTADHLCEAAGLHLVSIDSAAQNAWIIEQTTLFGGGSWWMGYTDAAVEGTWAWTDGSPSGYENWYPSEPSDGIDPENCAAVPEHSPTTWNDLPCDLLRPFVCEL